MLEDRSAAGGGRVTAQQVRTRPGHMLLLQLHPLRCCYLPSRGASGQAAGCGSCGPSRALVLVLPLAAAAWSSSIGKQLTACIAFTHTPCLSAIPCACAACQGGRRLWSDPPAARRAAGLPGKHSMPSELREGACMSGCVGSGMASTVKSAAAQQLGPCTQPALASQRAPGTFRLEHGAPSIMPACFDRQSPDLLVCLHPAGGPLCQRVCAAAHRLAAQHCGQGSRRQCCRQHRALMPLAGCWAMEHACPWVAAAERLGVSSKQCWRQLRQRRSCGH